MLSNDPGDDPCEALPWDSQFFGFPVARVRGHRLDHVRAAAVDAWCRREAITCLYFLAGSDDAATAAAAVAHGFGLMDLRVTLEARAAPKTVGELRDASAADLPALRGIARASYHDSRFYRDPRFPRARCDALYETWIEKSVGGWAQAVLVAGSRGAAEGFITCHLDPGSGGGSIGLVGVAETARGQGLGRALVGGALGWFARHGAGTVTVVTQGANVPAQRLYQGAGFRTRSIEIWFHKWFDVPGGAA